MGLDLGSIVLMVALLAAPAVVVLTIFAILQKRRGRFHRQRITKERSSKHS